MQQHHGQDNRSDGPGDLFANFLQMLQYSATLSTIIERSTGKTYSKRYFDTGRKDPSQLWDCPWGRVCCGVDALTAQRRRSNQAKARPVTERRRTG